MPANQLNKFSSRITQPASQGASQAMLMATGLTWKDLDKPQIGIASVWYEGNPCNMHLADFGNRVKQGVEQAGCVGMRFNTIGISDAHPPWAPTACRSPSNHATSSPTRSKRSWAPSGTTASSPSPAATTLARA